MSKYKKKVYIPLTVCDYVSGCEDYLSGYEDKKCENCDKKRVVIEESVFQTWMQPNIGKTIFYSKRGAREHSGDNYGL